jgi:hypothetical protein
MPTTQKPAATQTVIKNNPALAAIILLTASSLCYADNGTTTNSMPVLEGQEASSQEVSIQKNPNTETSTEKIYGKVARAIFTSKIIDREPANDLAEMSNASDRIYFYTDLRNLEDKIVTHRWEYNDAIVAEVKFKVGDGPRWRVYSSKNLLPEWTGVWTVIVTDENERTLNTSVFNYTEAVKKVNSTTTSDIVPAP